MKVHDFIQNPEWWHPDTMHQFYQWATSGEVESSGEARRQLGYSDGYSGLSPASHHTDYAKGYEQGSRMREVDSQNNLC